MGRLLFPARRSRREAWEASVGRERLRALSRPLHGGEAIATHANVPPAAGVAGGTFAAGSTEAGGPPGVPEPDVPPGPARPAAHERRSDLGDRAAAAGPVPPADPVPPAGRTRLGPDRPARGAGALRLAARPALSPGVLDPGRAGVRALAAIAVAAALLAATFWWRSRPEPVPAPPAPTVAALVASPTPFPATVVVDVGGKVREPGVIELPEGSRVVDAIEAAGGVRDGVDTGQLNMARRLVDGEQILVGVAPTAVPVPPAAAAGTGGLPMSPIDLNTATAEQLEQLPGVGPVLAGRIVEYRMRNGGFRSVDQLREVSGIGPKRFADLKDRVRV